MPELIRSLAARLRELIGNRRSALRYQVRLRCTVALLNDGRGSNHHGGGAAAPRHHAARLDGHSFDLSTSGVGLLLPAVRLGEQYFVGEARALRVYLQTDTGRTLCLDVLPVRYERADEENGAGFLVGARIAEMSADDRAQYVALLRRLKNKAAPVTNRAAVTAPAAPPHWNSNQPKACGTWKFGCGVPVGDHAR